jgi:hypothetical protein
MSQVIKPKPGIYNGVRYRSQLEISWAKWFDEVGVEYEYIDTSTHDFKLNKYGEIEVKPKVASLVVDAFDRMIKDRSVGGLNLAIGERLQVMSGNPPSSYGFPVLFTLIQTFLHGFKNGWVILAAEISEAENGILRANRKDWFTLSDTKFMEEYVQLAFSW